MIKYYFKQRHILLFFLSFLLFQFLLSGQVYAEETNSQVISNDADKQNGNENLKNILIINSYHEGFSWTRGEIEGILNNLDNSDCTLSVSVEFMDWKQYPTVENLNNFSNYMEYKYRNKTIDLIITTDDMALQYSLENRENFFSNAPIVFCGINKTSYKKLTKGYSNFTGVLEEIDPTETIKMAMQINPSIDTVYILHDNSESGISTGEIVTKKIHSMNKNFNILLLNHLSYSALIQNVKNYDQNSIILLTTYYSDSNGTIIDYENASSEISKNSSVPVYSLYDMSLNHGALGGNMLSGELQGENAADLATRILSGEQPDNISIQSSKITKKVIDYKQMERFGISKNNIPKNYEIINKPFSFFETYQSLIIKVVLSFIILIIFILILLYYIRKISNMKKELMQNNEELTQIYEELSASDEELRQQFEEICYMRESLEDSEERFKLAIECSNSAIWDIDLQNNHYHFTDRCYELLGYVRGEFNEQNGWKELIHEEDRSEADNNRILHWNGEIPYCNFDCRLRKKDGEYVWFNIRGKVLKDRDGNLQRFLGSLINIDEKKAYEEKLQESYQELEATYEELTATQDELQLQYDEVMLRQEKLLKTEEKLANLAYFDTLTGLPNRQSLYEDSGKTICSYINNKVALLFIDMDNFKYVNDTMGHLFGDQLLIKVGERLSQLRKEDSHLYRLGGDEFIMTLQNIQGREGAEEMSSSILSAFSEGFEVLNSMIYVTLSIGIVIFPEDGHTVEELLKCADIAMYRAKEAGRNKYMVYNRMMNEEFTERMNIEKHLRKALEKREFSLQYQPQLDISTNKVTGFEALLRWNNDELGFVSPAKFIQIAEDTQFIIPLGTWVLRNACAFLKELQNKGYTDLTISVNLSILQIIQADFYDLVMDTIKTYEIKPDNLELEITETILMESFDVVGAKLTKLREQGIHFALDDFGKGYSSLSYLEKLPISTLKIDKTFIDNLYSENEVLTRHIIAIGRSLGMSVVAEGVEDQEQLDYLIRHECDKIQGYFFSKPLPEVQVVELLKNMERSL